MDTRREQNYSRLKLSLSFQFSDKISNILQVSSIKDYYYYNV